MEPWHASPIGFGATGIAHTLRFGEAEHQAARLAQTTLARARAAYVEARELLGLQSRAALSAKWLPPAAREEARRRRAGEALRRLNKARSALIRAERTHAAAVAALDALRIAA